jgi:hypothetical protein
MAERTALNVHELLCCKVLAERDPCDLIIEREFRRGGYIHQRLSSIQRISPYCHILRLPYPETARSSICDQLKVLFPAHKFRKPH